MTIDITGTPYHYDARLLAGLEALTARVQSMRDHGELSPEDLRAIRDHLRIRNIYHSNAIEGSTLSLRYTRLVVEEGAVITSTPLRHSYEARNLARALEFAEDLSDQPLQAILESDIRKLNALVLEDVERTAGAYRRRQVYISGSNFLPPSPERVPAAMQAFGHWMKETSVHWESGPMDAFGLVAASVAHTWFVSNHPFIDGNGRTARLLMNLTLTRYGFPIAVITIDDRPRYMEALQHDEDSHKGDLTPIIALIAECVGRTLDEYEKVIE